MSAVTTVARAADPPPTLVFEPIERVVSNNKIQVFHGNAPAGGMWKSILLTKMATGDLRSCTAAMIGDDALLTAAHCVDINKLPALARVAIRLGPVEVMFKCQIDPSYAGFPGAYPRSPSDFAICTRVTTDANGKPLAPPPNAYRNLPREYLDLSAPVGAASVLLTGYGCVGMAVDLADETVEAGPFDEVFRVGRETLAPSTAGDERLVTVSQDAVEPALCKGDSGAPLLTGVNPRLKPECRAIIGVASQVAVENHQLVSRYAALSSPTFKALLADSGAKVRIAPSGHGTGGSCATT